LRSRKVPLKTRDTACIATRVTRKQDHSTRRFVYASSAWSDTAAIDLFSLLFSTRFVSTNIERDRYKADLRVRLFTPPSSSFHSCS
jgi:hypothetical protein